MTRAGSQTDYKFNQSICVILSALLTQTLTAYVQELLETLGPQVLDDLLSKAERQEADLLQHLKETAAEVVQLADRVRQSHINERAPWNCWLSRPDPDALDTR